MLVWSVLVEYSEDWLVEVKLPLFSRVLAIDVSVLAWVFLTSNRHDVHVKNADQEVMELLVLIKLRAHETEEKNKFFSC